MKNFYTFLYTVASCAILTACAGTPPVADYRTLTKDKAIADARGKGNIPSAVKIGKTYKANGKTFTPAYQPDYDEVGMASWYGPGFHGSSTATGESFDQYEYTAAHPTLPLPSLVRVTNLENGREAIVRINDRGPFHGGRIIDLSHHTASALGMKGSGVARVRVTYLEEETREMWDKLAMVVPKDMPASGVAKGTTQESVQVAGVTSRDLQDLPIGSRKYPLEKKVVGGDNFALISSAQAAEPAMVQPLPVTGSHFVQAGAFSNKQSAEDAAFKLSELGSAMLLPVDVAGRTLYRVRVGPVANAEEGRTLQGRLVDLGFKDAKLVAGSL